jgi:predicted anti-sigma-YlaC factor YlaD
MTTSDHQRARKIIALASAEDPRADDQTWLHAHLQQCSSCRQYADAASQMSIALQSDFLLPDFALMRATQIRLHARAAELRHQRDRLWLIASACLFVGLSAAITTPFLWRAFAWMGLHAGVPAPAWEAAFTFFWFAPALVAGVILIARGVHLDHNLKVQLTHESRQFNATNL